MAQGKLNSTLSGLFRHARSGSKGGSGGSGNDKGPIKGIANKFGNAVLNAADSVLSIKDEGLGGGLFNKKGDDDDVCTIVQGWECPRLGKYAHPIDCQKWVKCSLGGENKVYECEDDEAYDPDQRTCTTDWSTCEALEQCLYHRQLIEDPSDDNSYFICIRNSKKFKESYSVNRRQCTAGRSFDPDYQLCIDDEDSKKIKKAKKRHQKLKKQKSCKNKKKGNKKGHKNSSKKKKKTSNNKKH